MAPADALVNRDDPIPVVVLDGSEAQPPSSAATGKQKHESDHSDPETPSRPRGLRGRFSALKDKANIQDRLVEKLLQQVIPTDDMRAQPTDAPAQDGSGGSSSNGQGPAPAAAAAAATPATTERPNFNITTMSVNFRRFNARIGVVFVFQAQVERLLAWQRPTHTLSFLAVYTLACLDPYLLPVLPLAVTIVAVLIPSFAARHPDPEELGSGGPSSLLSSSSAAGGYYYASAAAAQRGPPLAPAVTVRPAKELSRDFFRNMRDLQNCMEDFSRLHDAVASLVVPRTNFSDEAQSTALFAALFALALLLSIASGALPWRLIFLAAGWAATCAGHPAVRRQLEQQQQQNQQQQQQGQGQGQALALAAKEWAESDIILDGAPETREVEIFELQRLAPGSVSGEWEPWLFGPSPYDPLSAGRLAGEPPAGARFFDDVRPPPGWEWSEKKWALDLWSREWVEERIITGVEIETEGERWVYDIYDENADRVGVVEDPLGEARARGAKGRAGGGGDDSKEKRRGGYMPGPSWEEGEDGDVRKGEWRRRRWVRLVRRKKITGDE
ncbi:Peroxisome size and maintenance regulator [Diatrype stigma]|uniref:Peroxisome size and maintenance regulator n=1 Tax=Diatrype stigma TaxID=117547 RepID=A0AAN9V9F0_9PEZI